MAKDSDAIKLGLFVIALVLLVAFVYMVMQPTAGDEALQIAELQQRVQSLETSAAAAQQQYAQCTASLAQCAPSGTTTTLPPAQGAGCEPKDVNFNSVCKALGAGTLLRVNADRETDINFQCETASKLTALFYLRTEEGTLKVRNNAYRNVLNLTGCVA